MKSREDFGVTEKQLRAYFRGGSLDNGVQKREDNKKREKSGRRKRSY